MCFPERGSDGFFDGDFALQTGDFESLCCFSVEGHDVVLRSIEYLFLDDLFVKVVMLLIWPGWIFISLRGSAVVQSKSLI